MNRWPGEFMVRHALASRIFGVSVALLICTSCEQHEGKRVYLADPIKAWVVDAKSGQPLEGVNVVAAWELKTGVERANVVGWLGVMEMVTDAGGEFSFPSWGPIVHEGPGAIGSGAPLLLLFKKDYSASALDNDTGNRYAPEHLRSYWNGRKIPLTRFEGSIEDYARDLAVIGFPLRSLVTKGGCQWKQIPRMLWAVQQQNREFVARRTFWRFDFDRKSDQRCGSFREYVEEHGQ